MKTHSATLKKKSFRLHLCHQIICFLSLYCLHLFQCKCFYQSYWLQNFAPLNLKRKRKKVPWLSQYVILTYLTAASTLDFVTARVRAALMGLNMNHCVTAVPVVILKMNHGPCTLDLRDTSIINLWKRRQEREKTWRGQRSSYWNQQNVLFLFYIHTHVRLLIGQSLVVAREAISQLLVWTTSAPATSLLYTSTGLLRPPGHPQLSTEECNIFSCGLECDTLW